MTISDADYTAWLSSTDAVRTILVEAVANVASVETTRYLSSKAYFDGVAARNYDPCIRGSSVKLVERLSLDGNSSMSFGDIEIENLDGSRDSWLNDVWSNRSVKIFIGDVRWARADFRTIFDGIAEGMDTSARDVLNIKLRDKMQRLNTPVSETKLGGTTKNKDELIPLTFGEVHNVTPLLADPATLQYQVHNGAIESIIEVRDNGVPVSFTPTVATGKFTLLAAPYGQITASVQGDKPVTWDKTVKKVIERIVKDFGHATNRFTASDLDSTNLTAFDTANPQSIGIYIRDRENVIEVCNALARSVGAQIVMSRQGQLQLIKIAVPPSGTPIGIGTDDIIQGTLQITELLPVQAAQKVGYCKNWTVQDKLETGIPADHKELFAQDWLTFTTSDSSVKTLYKIDAEPEQVDTLLLTEADAITEATRLLNLYKVQRKTLSFEGTPRLVELELGDPVTITHPRFGLSGGVTGMVIGLSIDWSSFKVSVEVLV